MENITIERKIFVQSEYYLAFLKNTKRKNTIFELTNYINNLKLYDYNLYRYIVSLYEFDNFLVHI